MANPRELLYEHAPLTEVIAEIHWALTPLQMAPGAAIDPFYPILEDRLTAQLAQSGFVHIEARVPDEIPREMLPHAVVRLFRTAPGTWPAYQIGPGVFTANVVPPYGGWSKFRPFLRQGMDYLLNAYPDKAHLKPERIVLRYVNAFGPEHGLTTPGSFISEYVGLSVGWPDAVREVADASNEISFMGDLRIPIASLPGASAFLSWKEGTRPGGDKVVLLNLSVNSPMASNVDIEIWSKTFDSAHEVISKVFEGIIEKKIRPLLGKELKA
ncbi:TIGR04255 family protein [Mesorhizobium sp. M0050]|uniref:TIGR04255 family protein n=1 Tax=Mesorhizobium sp. M0050 TaxID=2956861 RepID=UPI00333C7959